MKDRAAELAALVAAGAALAVQPIPSAELAVPTALAARADEPAGTAPAWMAPSQRSCEPKSPKKLEHGQLALVLHFVMRYGQPSVPVGGSSHLNGSWRELLPGMAEHSC